MRVVSWNTQGNKKKNFTPEALAKTILDHNPSVIALHEFNLHEEGNRLAAALVEAGFVAYASRVSGRFFRTIVFAPPGAQTTAVPTTLDGHVPYWIELRFSRIRVAVVKTFVDRDLAPGIFGRITAHDEIFYELVRMALDKWGGRSYLKQVREALMNIDSKQSLMRVHVITQVLD